MTHGSQAAENYERLEFLGDRVLGLVMAEWLWEQFPAEPEGQLSRRLNSLVTGAVCADVARDLGVREHLRLGKQARDDGASDSDNVLGDVMEALIGLVSRGRAGRGTSLYPQGVGDRVHSQGKARSIPSRRFRNGPPRTTARHRNMWWWSARARIMRRASRWRCGSAARRK